MWEIQVSLHEAEPLRAPASARITGREPVPPNRITYTYTVPRNSLALALGLLAMQTTVTAILTTGPADQQRYPL